VAYKKILPSAVDLDTKNADEQLMAHAKADWAAIDRAWERVKVAQAAYFQYFRGREDP
jgi:hypothetical protein